MTPDSFHEAANVLGVAVDALDLQRSLDQLDRILHCTDKAYICVACVHGVMEAQRDAELFQAYQCSAMTVPDGMPLVWTGWLQHHPRMAAVTGPDLMLAFLLDPRFRHLRHFLYGGKPGVAEELQAALRERIPFAQIAGTYTPPFRDLNDKEFNALRAQITAAQADVLWIGISCPRQELFMARHIHQLPTRLMFGVGAAFDFHTGHIRDCAPWIKQAGLQWLHRLLQDPGRLWKRYAGTNPAFVRRITMQLLCEKLRDRDSKGTSSERRQVSPATRP